ncbi:MAG: CARDB domain-containing protein [Solirubrobacteraceae bacterium]|nr:CARDB domain-containing protein [Solirubrobacteraceae bacterium]
MPSLRLLTPALSVAAALSLALVGGLAPDAHARAAAKDVAPTLKISSRLCSIGPTAGDRLLKFDVSSGPAVDETDRAAFRVRLQSRPSAKGSWEKVATTPTATEVGGWEIASKANTIVAATKSYGPLDEGVQYRALVDARAYNAAGKSTSKQATRIVTCNQPLFTGTLVLGKVVDTVASGTHRVSVAIRNAGRLASQDGTVTVFDATTRETLGTATVDALKGGGKSDVTVALDTCPGKVYVKVQPDGADPEDLLADQYTTIDCKATQSRKRSAR